MEATVGVWHCPGVSQLFQPCYAGQPGSSPPAPAPPLGSTTMVGEAEAGRTADAFQPASLVRRCGALFVDWILCLFISGIFARPFEQGWPPLVVLIIEYAFFIGLFAQTPGMM